MNTPVNFEISKLLKEKGFDEPTNKYYEHALTSKKDPETNDYTGAFGWKKGETNLASGYFKNNYGMADLSTENWYMCSAATIAEVLMWLYEKHNIWIYADSHEFGKWCYKYKFNRPYKELPKITERGEFSIEDYNSPTEAYEAAIIYTLENLI